MAKQEFGKKVESFGDSMANDFIAESEITVTITLHEYRQLVRDKSIADQKIAEANNDKWTRESENTDLKKENASLKQELYELKKKKETAQEETDGERNEINEG